MAKVDIIGPKDDLLEALDLLRSQGIFQPDPELLSARRLDPEMTLDNLILDEDELRERVYFSELQDRIESLLKLLPESESQPSPLQPLPVLDVIDELSARHLEKAREWGDQLREEGEKLDTYQKEYSFWGALEPLCANFPDNANLELIGVTIRQPEQLPQLEEALQRRSQGRCHISTARDADGSLVGLVATDRDMAAELFDVLTDVSVPERQLPEEFSQLPLGERISAMKRRFHRQKKTVERLREELLKMSVEWRPIYLRALDWLNERLALYRVTATAFATRQCFVIDGWMAVDRVEPLRDALNEMFGGKVVLQQRAILVEEFDRVPVSLRNPEFLAPFEIFSSLLPLPKYASYDPTPFIGLFFPVFFGMILGDVGYGLLIVMLAAFMAKCCEHRPVICKLGKVLGISAVYTMFFGLLYGEFFGNLGELWFDMHPLWFDRAKAIVPMTVFVLSVGTMHVLFGLLLGAWSSLRRHHRREGVVKLVMLVLIIVLALLGIGTFYPQPWLAVEELLLAIIVLLPVLIAAGGLLAPLELLKTIGNIISYVRIMAIGLCSVLLAVVANRLGGLTGDILTGILVAGILHAFNLLLGLFAPTVHGLRLHYVEFFSKFLDLGGRRFEPWVKTPHK